MSNAPRHLAIDTSLHARVTRCACTIGLQGTRYETHTVHAKKDCAPLVRQEVGIVQCDCDVDLGQLCEFSLCSIDDGGDLTLVALAAPDRHGRFHQAEEGLRTKYHYQRSCQYEAHTLPVVI